MKFVIFITLVLVFGGLVSFVCAEELTEVEKTALFDIFIEIPPEYRVIDVGGKLIFTLRLVNLGGAGRIDVFLENSVIDAAGEIILDRRETVAIETQASFYREVDLQGMPAGEYELYVKLIYADGKEADARHLFKIGRVISNEIWFLGFVVAGVLIVVGIIFLYPKIKLLRDKMRIKSHVKRIVRKVKVV